MKNALTTLWHAFRRYRWHVIALVVFGFISALLEGIGINAVIPLISFFNGGVGGATDFITRAIQGLFAFLHIPFSFRYLLGFIFCLFIVRAVSVTVFGYIRSWVHADFIGKESEDVLRRTLLSSWAFLLTQKIGTMHGTLVRDVQQTGSLLGAVVQVVQSFTGFLMYLLVAINISPTITLYTLGGGAVLFIVLRPLLRRSQRVGTEAASAEKQFAQFLSEHIIGMKSIKSAGAERSAIATGNGHIQTLRRLSIRQGLMGTLSTSFFQPTALVVVALLFLLTYHTPSFSIISFAASLYLIQKIFTYFESGQNSLQAISTLIPYARNVAHFKRALASHRELAEGAKPFMLAHEIRFENVSFAYQGGEDVLTDVSFTVKTGQIVGLIGPSGAGKTSAADLLLRLFKPRAGALLLDGVPSDAIAFTEWRQHIGYVSQDVFLLHDTIEENIRFYDQNLTSEDIERAAKQANIYDFIHSLPAGFQTTTGDRGVLLSGGQRQRIALARALARKPQLLILDEATSALDHESEKLIHESIKALRGTVTVLIIAHRASTVAEADQIVVLGGGRVVEQGTPAELLTRRDSYFSHMQNA